MKNTKKNTVVTKRTTSTGATETIKSDKASLTTEELVQMGADFGAGYMVLEGAKDSLNKLVENARNAGLKLVDLRGKSKNTEQGKQTQVFKGSLTDTLVAGGKTASYAQKVYELVSSAINSGKAITSTHKGANKAGKTNNNKTTKAGKGAGKSTKSATKSSTFPELLLAVYNHVSFKTLSEPARKDIIAKLEKAKLIEA
mgnify:CR=1 FL=1